MNQTSLQQFCGTNNVYTAIGTRGAEVLGVALNYERSVDFHDGSVGQVTVRFAAHSTTGQFEFYSRFSVRRQWQFRSLDANGIKGPKFPGVQLNKVTFPVFKNAPKPAELALFGDHFGLWPVLAEWITAQATADGFALGLMAEELAAWVREDLVPVVPPPTAIETVTFFNQLSPLTPKPPKPTYQPTLDDEEDGGDGHDDEDIEDEDEDDEESVN